MHYPHFKPFLHAILLALSLSGCANGRLPPGYVLDPSGACYPEEFELKVAPRYLYYSPLEIEYMFKEANGRPVLAFTIPGNTSIVILPTYISERNRENGWTIKLLKKHEDGHAAGVTIDNCLEELRRNPQILNPLVRAGSLS